MTDAKLDPKSLSAEERAIVDLSAMYKHLDRVPGKWSDLYEMAMSECEDQILARRAIFGGAGSEAAKVEFVPTPSVYPPAETGMSIPFQIEPVKVECPNCKKAVDDVSDHLFENPSVPLAAEDYTCQPAQPEPAARVECPHCCDSPCMCAGGAQPEPASEGAKVETTADRIAADLKAGTFRGTQPEPVASVEMPEAVRCAVGTLREFSRNLAMRDGFYCARDSRVAREAADALESFWRTHSQPTPARMSAELKRVFAAAFKRACDFHAPTGEAQQINQDIAAVRAQAAEVVKLPKVPVADIQWALNIAASKAVTMSALEACQRIKRFLAEIDAAERVAGK